MSDAEKQPFVALSRQDSIRFKREYDEFRRTGFFTDEQGVHSVQLAIRKRSFKPHIILPKLVKRSKDIFISKNYAAKAAQFDYRPKPMEVMSELCKDWNLLTAKDRVKYEKLIADDQARYNQQMKDLTTKGWFTHENGSRVRHHLERPKKPIVETPPSETLTMLEMRCESGFSILDLS